MTVERLALLARRAESDPSFLASILRDYAHFEQLDASELATTLKCRIEDLPLLAVCLRPRPAAPHFRHDVDRICARFSIDPVVLALIVRRVDSVIALRTAASTTHGLLMAARDSNLDDESDHEQEKSPS